MKIAIVGAGIHGRCTAYWAAKSGHQVTIFEQFSEGHNRGSSHGNTRIVRKAYPSPFYTELMLEGYPLWKELENAANTKLVYECGLAYYGHPDESFHEGLQGLVDLKVPHTVHDQTNCQTVFPGLKLDAAELLIFTPEAGFALAAKTLEILKSLSQAHGAIWRYERVSKLESLVNDFDRIIVTAGLWVRDFAKLEISPSIQTFCYVDIDRSGPVWIEHGGDFLYGFPTEPNHSGIKIGVHTPGPDVPLGEIRPGPDPISLEKIRDLCKRRFGTSNPQLNHPTTCVYTNTPDSDFRIGWLSDKILIASPCSGHGFKFGPWIGKHLTLIASGEEAVETYPRFACHPTPKD